ncbi:ATP-binding protein [Bradyrhizobium embrapense]|uniref:ATP-binding protein n=1 Tax=Bradyrhizobium embrapense TaxID=630921 RepID=UPI0007C4666A|nr:ATP-binding protein [Bradyrhizobium embrapense]
MAKGKTRATPPKRTTLKKKTASKGPAKKTTNKPGKGQILPGRKSASQASPKKESADLARAGGNATTAGVTFQASVGAVFAVQMLAETVLDDRLGLGDAKACGIRFESEAAVDDCGIETDVGGWIFIQAKTGVTLSAKADSDLRKTAGQMIRLWHSAKRGRGKNGWDRPLDPSKDRLLLAAGPTSSGSVTRDLARALDARRARYAAPLPKAQSDALTTFVKALKAEWKTFTKASARESDLRVLLPLVFVISFDMAGADRAAAIAGAGHLVTRPSTGANAFIAIEKHCQHLMEARLGDGPVQFRTALSALGISLKAPPRYEVDVAQLARFSAETSRRLAEFEKTTVSGLDITVSRHVTQAMMEAAQNGSFLVIGEPGSGKSAVISAAAAALREQKYDVVELAADQLPVASVEGMRVELGLEHRIVDVLENWPGSKPAFLFIDALDATRGGAGEHVFRSLIDAVVRHPSARWRVIASIRSFDLRMGEHFRALFKGKPPSAAYASKDFLDIRHITVPPWTDAEFSALRAKAPSLDQAITRGGEKLRDLARVPFNTRLLAELITNGATPETFHSVASQVALLALYWRKRVEQHGSGAELCLRAAVAEMVTDRTLRARRTTAAAPDPDAFDAVQKDGVVMQLSDVRLIGFRHHILFDYAASRLFIDPLDVAATVDRLRNDRSLSLMLAPAIGFALQALWETDDPAREAFWAAVSQFAGGTSVDPVARSIAARIASEQPRHKDDLQGFLLLLQNDASRKTASVAFAHVVGSIIVRVDDGLLVVNAAWCHLAARISSDLEGLAWPLRTLLTRFSDRLTDPAIQADFGLAARALFAYALDRPAAVTLLPIAIELVVQSYRSDTAASRALLAKTLAAGRLESHAHEDIPALARQAKLLLDADPDFLVEIFGVVFGYNVSDDSATSIGSSQILALTSNRRQDYDHAKWELKEVVPRFLKAQPETAIRAISAALAGYARQKYGDVRTIEVPTAGVTLALIEDDSHIWASDPNDRHAHADNAGGMLLAFKTRLETASDDDARALTQYVIRHAKPLVLWSRLFLVGAGRAAVLGRILWPYASSTPILRSSDTAKDAIDVVAAVYPLIDHSERLRFEERICGVTYQNFKNPERAQLVFLGRLFGAIGSAHLATEQARRFIVAATAQNISTDNRRTYEFEMRSLPVEPYYWLPEGVDAKAPANAKILRLIEIMDVGSGDLQNRLAAAEAVAAAIHSAGTDGVALRITEHAEDQLGYVLPKLAREQDTLRKSPMMAARLWSLVSPMLTNPRPEAVPGKSIDRGPRASATDAALRLCTISQLFADNVFPAVEPFSNDPNAGVRYEFANHFGCLWEFRRADLWRIAEQYVECATDKAVLNALTGFLCWAIHHDVERVEDLALKLHPRAGNEEDVHGDSMVEGIASVVTFLWTRYDRPRAHSLIQAWLAEPETYDAELGRVVASMRGHITSGYQSRKTIEVKLRAHFLALAAEIVARAASCLEAFYTKGGAELTEPDSKRVRACARLIDQIGDQLYFSSGAAAQASEDVPLAGIEPKRAFLRDATPIIRRLGDVAVPHTIYYLIELLDFLRPADPETVFDLIAHALLTGGPRHGYEFEPMAVNRFVTIVGTYLADHRGIFVSSDRRESLISCLDIFVNAGWPTARRLLYRLPELL